MRVAIGAWPWPNERAWKRLDIPEFSASCNNALVGSCKYDIEHHSLTSDKSFLFCHPLWIKHGQQQTKPVNRQTSRREDNEVRNTRELTQSINDICILISRTHSVQYNHCLRSQSLPGRRSFVTSQMSVLRYQSIWESFNESAYMAYRGYTIKRSWQQTFYVGMGQNKATKWKDCWQATKGVKAK